MQVVYEQSQWRHGSYGVPSGRLGRLCEQDVLHSAILGESDQAMCIPMGPRHSRMHVGDAYERS